MRIGPAPHAQEPAAEAERGAPPSRQAIGWARTLGYGLAAGVTATVVSLFVWTLLPMAAGWRPSVVVSGSMVPAIRPGDIVVTAPVDARRLRTGHIVQFADPAIPGRRLVHRIVGFREGGTFITRGDANLSNDSTPLPRQNIEGLARLRVPFIGLPVVWLRQGRVTPLALTVVSLVLVALVLSGGRRAEGDPGERGP